MELKDKKIIVAVSGSIAAYKAAVLVRLLVKKGAEVQVILTHAATQFITPLTMATLSKKPALIEYQSDPKTGEWNNHVELGLWADLMLIAPASANTISKMANGICDNLLLATYLSARCPVFFCPAMDLDMYLHPATQRNIGQLATYGNILIEPTFGELASGLVGKGRLAEPEEIISFLESYLPENQQLLKGKNALVTAGGTTEYLDPVRFISNKSTGKMGYALAEELARQGAKVCLVSGATALATKHPNIQKINVESANQMYEAVMANLSQKDIIVHCAAVADYAPKQRAEQKIKKNEDELSLELVKTKDIAKEVGKRLGNKQLHVGFALETHNETQNAIGKLERKNLHLIVLNSLQDQGAGFGHDTNKVTVFMPDAPPLALPLKTKTELATDLVSLMAKHLTLLTLS